MKIYKKHGTKEKLFEMMEGVNKITLNESFDVPGDDDAKYLNQGGDLASLAMQPNKYDDGTRQPRNKDIQVKDKSLEKMKGDNQPIEEGVIDVLKKEFNDLIAGWEQMKPQTYGHRSDAMNTPTGDIGQQQQGKERLAKELLNIIRQHGENSPQAKQFKTDNPPPPASTNNSYMGESEEEEDVVVADLEDTASDEMGALAADDVATEPVTPPADMDGGEEDIDIGSIEIDSETNGEEALEGGLADGASPADFDPKQILLGMEVEMEHTHTPHEALEIAMDHLKEDPAYYGNGDENPDLEAQNNAADDASEIEAQAIGTDSEEEEAPENMEDDDLSVNMNWLETIKPNKVDDMEI